MKAITLIALLAGMAACTDDADNNPPTEPVWKQLGLIGKSVNELQIHENTLYVATTTGLYKKQTDVSDDFVFLGFEDLNVEAIEVLDDKKMVASLFDKSGSEPARLYQTVNGGTNWVEIVSNFGGQMNEPAFDIKSHPDNKDILYATGYSVIAKSINGGIEWQPIYGGWNGFATGVSVVEINPLAENEIWAGGQGAIENGFLLHSANESDWTVWNDLVPNPTVVKEVTFSGKNAQEVLAGFEGGLVKTTDNGQHWQTLIHSEDNRFFFGICRRKQSPSRVYAGGWLKTSNGQPLILYISDDNGATWREYQYPSEAYGGILDMQIMSEQDGDVLYIGLDKGGVYQATIRF